MSLYYLNRKAQSTGEHEVHKSNCVYLPVEQDRIYLGTYDNCKAAVKKAKGYYSNVNGCYHCSNDCHTR